MLVFMVLTFSPAGPVAPGAPGLPEGPVPGIPTTPEIPLSPVKDKDIYIYCTSIDIYATINVYSSPESASVELTIRREIVAMKFEYQLFIG